MDRQKLIAALAQTQEDQVLLAQVWDRFSAGERRNIPTSTGFLSGREQVLAEQLVRQGRLGEPSFSEERQVPSERFCVTYRITTTSRPTS